MDFLLGGKGYCMINIYRNLFVLVALHFYCSSYAMEDLSINQPGPRIQFIQNDPMPIPVTSMSNQSQTRPMTIRRCLSYMYYYIVLDCMKMKEGNVKVYSEFESGCSNKSEDDN